jgi:short-subunit dehydrogenase
MHNAGVLVHGPTQTTSHSDWLFGLNVNLWGPIHGVEAFAQRMVLQGQGGHHVFTASFAGLVPNVMLGAYNVSKAGVAALADSLRIDLHGTGIGVSLLCPMVVQTNITNSTRNRPPEFGGPVVTRFDEASLAHLGRTLNADQVAALVVDGVRHNRRYIHTHKEAEKPIRNRMDKLLAAFEHAL